MASTVIKNWDNKTWLSSQNYINKFNKFLLKNIKLNSRSIILDIGCGRGNILGNLKSQLKLKTKPFGIDIINHKDKDKRINFKKINALKFFDKNKYKFDLILIKQTIHLLSLSEIKKLLSIIKTNLTSNGKIFIFNLDTDKNELPTFKLMKSKLSKSIRRDKDILKLIIKSNTQTIKKKFFYRVKITKKKYLSMIQNRYISTLLTLTKKELNKGLREIHLKYKKDINFKDKLICLILQNSSK
ncbi:class I SAM-dependent methyltransferase [Candidatus Pelagibacter sp.]|jgi:ubiquinone/menaquinone biosynthesis C-methylase UbiE|nr:class I SAM-dependent methyltransferase [Candidatus Pelagibacter sp.]